jgi:hypothetical protein
MEENIRVLLAEAFGDLRNLKRIASSDLALRLAYTSGLVDGLKHADKLTASEAGELNHRIADLVDESEESMSDSRIALPMNRGSMRYHSAGAPTNTSSLRLVAGPYEAALFDGRLRVVALEISAERVYVHWRIAPLPTLEAILGEQDSTAFYRDLEGIDPEIRNEGGRHLVYAALHNADLHISDGTVTRFRRVSGGGGGNGTEEWGVSIFEPAPAAEATMLELAFHGARVAIPIG